MKLSKNCLLASILVLAASALAVTGVVLDSLGAPIASVNVELIVDGNVVSTGANGTFLILPTNVSSTKQKVEAIPVRLSHGILQFTLSQSVKGSIRTLDLQGSVIYSIPFQQMSAGSFQYNPLGSSQVKPGIYVIQYQLGNQKGIFRLVVVQEVAQSDMSSKSVVTALRKTTEGVLDSVKFSKQGYVTKSLAINTYTDDLGSIVMQRTPSSMVSSSSSAIQSSSSTVNSSSSLVSSSSSAIQSSSSTVNSSSSLVSSSSQTLSSSSAYTCSNTYGTNTVKDCRDNHTYKTVVIGTQTWMAENLAYLPSVNDKADSSSTVAKYYVFDYDGTDVTAAKITSNYTTYGVLYNWTAAMTACLTGWHLATSSEWSTLATYVGGFGTAGTKLKSVTGWDGGGDVGTDSYGFSALPGGFFTGFDFGYVGSFGFWWAVSEIDAAYGDSWSMDYYNAGLGTNSYSDYTGLSVRCVQD